MYHIEEFIIVYVPSEQMHTAEEFFCDICCKIGLDQALPLMPKSYEDHEYLILKKPLIHKSTIVIKIQQQFKNKQ